MHPSYHHDSKGPEKGALFRSQEMQFIRLSILQENAVKTMRRLGEFGQIHFLDLNEDKSMSDSARVYRDQLLQCAEMERTLTFLEEEVQKHNILLDSEADPGPDPTDDFYHLQQHLRQVEPSLRVNLEAKAEHTRMLSRDLEKKFVLERAGPLIEDPSRLDDLMAQQHAAAQIPHADPIGMRKPLISGPDDQMELGMAPNRSAMFKYICGVILDTEKARFERMIFRVSRGNAFVRFIDIEQPIVDAQGNYNKKSVFVVFFMGSAIQMKLSKIVESFQATVYLTPDTGYNIPSQLAELNRQIRDNTAVIKTTEDRIQFTIRHEIAPRLRRWQTNIRKEKAIYHTLNMFRKEKNSVLLMGDGWVPKSELHILNDHLHDVEFESAVVRYIETDAPPPTAFKLNKFTSVFQDIVNTYGVPRYQEVNPGIFTIVTFPFLFAVMYGDIGHGGILLLFSLWVVFNEKRFLESQKKKQLGEMTSMLFAGRYVLLLMGFFAVYVGFIYNDCFALGINFFGSSYEYETVARNGTYVAHSDGSVYPFGIDPAWHTASTNELLFVNSLKMKMSIIIAVVHMTFGILLSAVNHRHFKDNLSLYLQFVPQLIFMISLFGYMCFLIIYKWCVEWKAVDGLPERTQIAPNLISTMIDMFLNFGGTIKNPLYPGQSTVQAILVVLAFVCVPIMLFPKPIIKHMQMKRHLEGHAVHGRQLMHERDDDEKEDERLLGNINRSSAVESHGHGKEHSFGEEFIHQAIHTIEFVLGTVSNTASYLRLWALSLAHAQLAKVFWERLFLMGITSHNVVLVVVCTGAFALITTGVLLMMDVLECFLHALRLHWVEFQNKFYYADGYKFVPFSLAKIE